MSMDSVEALKRSRNPSLLWKRIRPTYAPALDTADDEDPLLPQRPLPNSYWATPILLGSEYPADRSDEITTMKLTALLDVGIRDFYDLTEAEELKPYDASLRAITMERGWTYEVGKETTSSSNSNSVRHRRFPIKDGGIPDANTLHAILDAIEQSRERNRMAVIHCFGGIGRTGTIVGCWLVRGEYVKGTGHHPAGQEALGVLERKWRGVEKNWKAPKTPETARQMALVRTFMAGGI
ncbi:hypothetical protein FRB96_004204 [Tulasnella sp. 330]|nr:hypothetical protein FRB96_004204 [Tulasnella sp. 330]